MKLRRIILLLLLLLLVVGIGFLGPWLSRYIKIDSCLDLGGRWNYQTETCEGAQVSG
jgi:hypothetical protein